jgi:hypothetical protein
MEIYEKYLTEKPYNKMKDGWYVFNEYHEEYPLYGPYHTESEAQKVARKFDGWVLEYKNGKRVE